MRYSRLLHLFFIVLPALVFFSCGQKPDVIYTNGKIHTMDDKNTVVEAVAVKDGKIIDTGSSKDIADKYTSDNVIDLQGKIVLPGLIDTDGSLVEFSRNLNFINLAAATTVTEILNLVKEKAGKTPDNGWIGGYGWNDLLIPEEELMKLDKKTIDEVTTKHNVYLINIAGNVVWTNSKLLETTGINKDSQDPEGGEIARDDNGEPVGIFFDSAVNLVKTKVPETSRGEVRKFIEDGAKELLKYGITEVHDRTVSSESINLIRELINEGKFPIRMYAVLSAGFPEFEEYYQKGIEVNYKDKLTVRAVSIDYDGAFEIQDAAMKNEYLKDPKRKTPYNTESEIENFYKRAIEKDFQFRVKAVGDDAVTASLNAIERVIRDKNPSEQRTVLEHAEFINQSDINRIKSFKLIPSVRPDICMTDMYYLPALIDSMNVNNLGLWNSLLQASGKITAGSDFPFHQISPFLQLYYLTTRQYLDTTLTGIPGANQKISLNDAIKAYTIWAAYSSFEDAYKGSIEKEKFADMVVLSNDIFADSKNLLQTKVLKTIINGSVVYENKDGNTPAGK